MKCVSSHLVLKKKHKLNNSPIHQFIFFFFPVYLVNLVKQCCSESFCDSVVFVHTCWTGAKGKVLVSQLIKKKKKHTQNHVAVSKQARVLDPKHGFIRRDMLRDSHPSFLSLTSVSHQARFFSSFRSLQLITLSQSTSSLQPPSHFTPPLHSGFYGSVIITCIISALSYHII